MFEHMPTIVAIPAAILGGAGLGGLVLELFMVPYLDRKRAQATEHRRLPLEDTKAWLFIREDRL